MATKSNIEWTEATWNPVRGCSRVSEGCRNCYAERTALRFAGPGRPYEGLVRIANGHPQWTGEVRFVPEMLDYPLRLKKPHRIFVNSMSDLFHDFLTDEQIWRVVAAMEKAHWHTYQVLTKRPARLQEFLLKYGRPEQSHIWWGVSCENQEAADERIPLLLNTPAAVRWVSAEPLLGPMVFHETDQPEVDVNWLTGFDGCDPKVPGLDWVVVGGESGPGARPCRVGWIRQIVEQCRAYRVPVFVKQLGTVPTLANGYEIHRRDKGGDISTFPLDLQIREYPRGQS